MMTQTALIIQPQDQTTLPTAASRTNGFDQSGCRYAMERKELDFLTEHKGVAYRIDFSDVAFDEKRGIVRGSRDDYLMAINATMGDFLKAIREVVEHPTYFALTEKMTLVSTPRRLRFGIFMFKLDEKTIKPRRMQREFYSVSATGQIRSHHTHDSISTKNNISRLKSTPPSMNLSLPASENIVRTYIEAFEGLLRRFEF